MMGSNKFTLPNYSALAGMFLLIPDLSDAQAVYTDLDPDIEIQYDGQTAGIDMDNNGTFDFAFLKTSGGYYFYWTFTSTQVYRFRHCIWAGPQLPENAIAGDYDYDSYAGPITYFPYALLSGTPINDDLSWQNWGLQIMEMGFTNANSEFLFRLGHWIPDEDSSFLGVRFVDGTDCLHYGWIRCTTADSSKRLIIHDYAYETKCETPIVAGDTIGDTSGVYIDAQAGFNGVIYSLHKTLYIQADITDHPNIRVTNLSGLIIFSGTLNNNFSEIPLDQATSGIYLVVISGGKYRYTKKVTLI